MRARYLYISGRHRHAAPCSEYPMCHTLFHLERDVCDKDTSTLSPSSNLYSYAYAYSSSTHTPPVLVAPHPHSRTLTSSTETTEIEKQALIDFYHSTKGQHWTHNTNNNWLTGDPCVNPWHGVTCDTSGGVAKIALTSNNVTGVLPQSLGVLSSLQILQLQFGKIGGTLPSSIGKLKKRLLFLSH